MEQTECPETSAYKIQTPGNYPEENIQHTEHGESLKSRKQTTLLPIVRVQPTRCTRYLKLFILVKRSTCFGRSFRPSSVAQNCVYSNGICQTAAATCCWMRWD